MVSWIVKASKSGYAKPGKAIPNNAANVNSNPLNMQNGFQNDSLFHPHFMIMIPRNI